MCSLTSSLLRNWTFSCTVAFYRSHFEQEAGFSTYPSTLLRRGGCSLTNNAGDSRKSKGLQPWYPFLFPGFMSISTTSRPPHFHALGTCEESFLLQETQRSTSSTTHFKPLCPQLQKQPSRWQEVEMSGSRNTRFDFRGLVVYQLPPDNAIATFPRIATSGRSCFQQEAELLTCSTTVVRRGAFSITTNEGADAKTEIGLFSDVVGLFTISRSRKNGDFIHRDFR